MTKPNTIEEIIANAVGLVRAKEAGGCFAPGCVEHCDDAAGCWCMDRCAQEARDVLTALDNAGLAVVPKEDVIDPIPDLDAKPCRYCLGTGVRIPPTQT